MFGPLRFPEEESKRDNSPLKDEEEVICILCTDQFPSHNELLTHIFLKHKMVIGDVPLIANLKLYLDYWRIKFTQVSLPHVCTTIQMNGEDYYLLSDVLPEDKLLRDGLHLKRLEKALAQQELERTDTSYTNTCMFCRHEITDKRSDYILHLAEHHNIQLGAPENLVYIDKLLEVVQQQIDNLKCLFCERTYKTRDVLKEHMRKKGHKRLNPHNELYDQFYIINYREMGKTWKDKAKMSKQSKSNSCAESDSENESLDSDWSDWTEEYSNSLVCLFCDVCSHTWSNILEHLQKEHQFDFIENVKEFDFYQQVKLVNYIRREVYWNTCPVCKTKFTLKMDLYNHMKEEKHVVVPDQTLWNCPEYFFSTYENDGFLCQLDDGVGDETDDVIKKSQSSPSTEFDNELFERLQISK